MGLPREIIVYFYAGAPNMPTNSIPNNVTGNCPHRHRTPEAAMDYIREMDRAIKRGHGTNAYCDRIVMVCDDSSGFEERTAWQG